MGAFQWYPSSREFSKVNSPWQHKIWNRYLNDWAIWTAFQLCVLIIITTIIIVIIIVIVLYYVR